MNIITIDQQGEMDFRRSVEDMLRCGRADDAANKLRGLLQGCAGEGRILPARFLTVSSDDVSLKGWDELTRKIEEYDRPTSPISAISIAITDPLDDGVSPDAQGRLAPSIRTSYFSDSAYPFSQAERADLLEGYSLFGCEWRDDYEGTDKALCVEGIDDLYGAVALLDEKVSQEAQPSREDIRAGTLGACFVAVLIHQATRDMIRRYGLPRPLCIMAGYHEVYPFFDAPVMSCDEYEADDVVMLMSDRPAPITVYADDLEASASHNDSSAYGNLAGLGQAKARKKPVIALNAKDAENADRFNQLAAEKHMSEPARPSNREVLAGFGSLSGGMPPAAPVEPTGIARSGGGEEPEVRSEPADRHEPEPFGADETEETESPIAAESLPESIAPDTPDEAGDAAASADTADFSDAPLPRIHVDPATPEEPAAPAASPTHTGFPEPQEPAEPKPQAYKPNFDVRTHNLRSRLVQAPQPPATRTGGISGLLRRIGEWIKRS